MGTILGMLLRGLAVGLFVSAPMGPVGILCIQRTLDKGRRTGLYTGVGAAISDFIYCLLTGFGLAFIEDFLEQNQNIIQLVGSAVLIGFAVYLFRKNPSAGLRKPDVQPGSSGKDILGGFLFTFSNPLILFLIIGLFARFNFSAPNHKFYHYIIGYLGIVGGALGWWWLVTYFVDKLRGHFNVRSMWLINRCIGVLILIFALVGIVTSVGSLTGWAADHNAKMMQFPSETFSEKQKLSGSVKAPEEIYFRLSELGKKKGGWNCEIANESGEGLGIGVNRIFKSEDSDPLYARRNPLLPQRHVQVRDLANDEIVLDTVVEDGFHAGAGINAWQLKRSGEEWTLWAGKDEGCRIGSFQYAPFDMSSLSFEPLDREGIKVSNVIVRGRPEFVLHDIRDADERQVKGIYELAALWGLYDYDLDPSSLQLGGNYRLRFVEVPYGYDMYYVSGAEKYPGSWPEGRLKGQLRLTPYPDIYDVIWIDPQGSPIEGGKGSVDSQSGYLSLQFPERNSSIRLRRIEESK